MFSYIKKIFTPRPTFFDLCVGVFLCLPWIRGNFAKSIFIVFYTAFLVALSIGLKPKRNYRSLPLALLTVWSLIGVFIHAFDIYPMSGTFAYKNFYLMAEGFLYIFFGVLFIHIVVKYATNLRYIYYLIPLSILPWYKGLVHFGIITPLAALAVSITIYLLLSKRYIIGGLSAITGLTGVALNWQWVSMKFACRPKIWVQLAKNMFYHAVKREGIDIVDPGIQLSPFLEKFFDSHILETTKPWFATLFGSGFSQYIGGEYTWVTEDKYGWLFRQNDYFALGECLGPIALVFVVWFVIKSFREIGIRPALIGFTTVAMTCFTRQTMFMPGKGGLCLLILAVCIWSGNNKKEDV